MRESAPAPAGVWSNGALWRLIWPLVVEQLLLVSMGMADTVMVTTAGEAAVSGISLVDAINILVINILAALATGGAVVASQYLGRKDGRNAGKAAKQLLYGSLAAGLVLMGLALALRMPILRLVYGHIAADVMENAGVYFLITAFSYPFLALYSAGAALFRSMGNSKVSMLTSLLVNLVNIGGNAVLIFGFGWGAAGAATSTLASRMAAAVVVMVLLARPGAGALRVRGMLRPGGEFSQLGRIFKVGVPIALENSTFQVGKLLVARIVSTFGTWAIAGNAIAGNLATFVNITGMAVGMGMVTVVGQCIGAGDFEAAKRNTTKLLIATHIAMCLSAGLVAALAGPVLGVMNLSAEATGLAKQCIWMFCAFVGVFWPPSFALPNALRAAGDTPFTMAASMVSMWVFRIGFAFLFAYTLGLGVLGVWMAMIVDWLVRAAAFLLRWRRGKWKDIRLIQ